MPLRYSLTLCAMDIDYAAGLQHNEGNAHKNHDNIQTYSGNFEPLVCFYIIVTEHAP